MGDKSSSGGFCFPVKPLVIMIAAMMAKIPPIRAAMIAGSINVLFSIHRRGKPKRGIRIT